MKANLFVFILLSYLDGCTCSDYQFVCQRIFSQLDRLAQSSTWQLWMCLIVIILLSHPLKWYKWLWVPLHTTNQHTSWNPSMFCMWKQGLKNCMLHILPFFSIWSNIFVHGISGEATDLVSQSLQYTDEVYPGFCKELEDKGWITSHVLFGANEWRAEW